MNKKKIYLLIFFLFVLTPVKTVFAADVCSVGGTGYTKLSTCISNVSDNVQTTITLLDNRTENITIPKNKNIILDLNNFTLSNSGNKTVITNNGTLELKNGFVTTTAESGMINNNKDAVLNITSGEYNATYTRQVLYNNNGTATISGGILTSEAPERAAVHNLNNGTLNITGGTIKSNGAYAVYNEKGTLNIGTLNDLYDQSTPVIQGKTYGVLANNNINVYDGIIKGGTYHIGKVTSTSPLNFEDDDGETKVVGIEDFSTKDLGEEIIGGITYSTLTYDLDPSTIAKITFNPVGGEVDPTSKKIIIGNSIGELPTPVKVNNRFDGWFTNETGGTQINENTKPSSNVTYYAHWTFDDPNTQVLVEGHGLMSLADALEIGGNIIVQKDIIVDSSLVMNKAANLDLNGFTINLMNNTIVIKEEVTIDDSSDPETGKITSTADFGIIVGNYQEQTNGYLTHKGGTIEGLGAYGAVRNYETFVIDGGTLEAIATDNCFTVYNDKDLIMNSGSIHSTNGRAIQVYKNATFVMNDGTVSTDADYDQAIQLYGDCSATINGGLVEGKGNESSAVAMFQNTELTINGGTLKGTGIAVAGNGNNTSANANITMNGGNIICEDGTGIYLPQKYSTTVINGGNITGKTAIEIRAADLIINGGSFTSTNDIYDVRKRSSGTTTYGAAIAVSQNQQIQPINVTINGGSFEGVVPISNANPMENPTTATDLININIKDGIFDSTGESMVVIDDTINNKKIISGGSYNLDPLDYLKRGYGREYESNRYNVIRIYYVTIDKDSIGCVEVDKTEYLFEEEVELKNIKDKKGYITTVVLYDTNGKKINIDIKDNKFIMPEKDVVVKIVYTGIINPIAGGGINPLTGDKIFMYMAILAGALTAVLVMLIVKSKKKKKDVEPKDV